MRRHVRRAGGYLLVILLVAAITAISPGPLIAQEAGQAVTLDMVPAGITGAVSGTITLQLPPGFELYEVDVDEISWAGETVYCEDYEYHGTQLLDTQTGPDGSHYTSLGDQAHGMGLGGGVLFIRGLVDIKADAQQYLRPYVEGPVYEEGYFSVPGDGSSYQGYYYLSTYTKENISTYYIDGEEIVYEWESVHHDLNVRIALSQGSPLYTVTLWAHTWGLPDRVDEHGWTHTYTLNGKPQLEQHRQYLKDLLSGMMISNWSAPTGPATQTTPAVTPAATPEGTPFADIIEQEVELITSIGCDLTSISIDSLVGLTDDSVAGMEQALQELEYYEGLDQLSPGYQYLGSLLLTTELQRDTLALQGYLEGWQSTETAAQSLGVEITAEQSASISEVSSLIESVPSQYALPSQPGVIQVELATSCSMLASEIQRLEREYKEALRQKEKYYPVCVEKLEVLRDDFQRLSLHMADYAKTEIQAHLDEAIEQLQSVILSNIVSGVKETMDLANEEAITALEAYDDIREGNLGGVVSKFLTLAGHAIEKANLERYELLGMELGEIGGPLGYAGHIQSMIETGLVLVNLSTDTRVVNTQHQYLNILNRLMTETQQEMTRLEDAPVDIMSKLSDRRAEYARNDCDQAEPLMLELVFPEFELYTEEIELYTGEIELYTGEMELYCGESTLRYEPVELEYVPVELEYLPVELEEISVELEEIPVELEYLPVYFVPLYEGQ